MEQKIIHVETEPIFGVHITFANGSKPIEYFNLNLKQTAKVLQEWSEEWILSPCDDCRLNDAVWNWNARVRHSEKPKRTEEPEDNDDELPMRWPIEFAEPEE